jgi:hypothetical protein
VFFFNLASRLALESRVRTHYPCKSVRFKQLIRDPLSVGIVHSRSTLQRQLRRQILKNSRYKLWQKKTTVNFMSEICPWLSITLHYSVCKWQWNSALRLLLPTPLCTKIVNGTQNWGHPTLMVLNSDWLSLGCLSSIIAWDMTFSLIFRFSHLLKYSGFFFLWGGSSGTPV